MFHTTTTHCIEFRAFSHCIEFRDGERWATTTSTMIGPAEGGGAQSLQTGQMGAGHLLWISTGRI